MGIFCKLLAEDAHLIPFSSALALELLSQAEARFAKEKALRYTQDFQLHFKVRVS